MIFSDPQDYDPLEEIELKANPPATSVGKPLILTAALAVGGFALTASAIVGGSLAALPAYFLLKRLKQSWKNHVFLRRFPGCYAHLIRDDRDMVEWIEAHGRDDVADQLRIALIQRQRLTPCAKRTANILIKPEALPHKSVTAYLSAIDQDATAETTANTTSGNSKSTEPPTSTAGTSTNQSSQEMGSAQDAHPQIQNIIVGDIALSLAHTFKPTIISARPRVGKGIIVSHAIAHAKQKYGLTVWILQPKPAPTELAYWKHSDRFLGINLEDHPRDCPIVAAQMTEFFMTWRAQPHRPTMLVIDEIVKIQAMQPKWYKDFLIPQCIVEASSGETDERFLYLITVSPLVGDLGMSGGNRSSFDFMAIEKAETTDHIESIKQSVKSIKAIPTEADFQISPIGSLIYHTALGRWAAVPRYDLPTIAPSDVLCPELEALVRPKPAYAVVSSGPNYDPIEIEPELPTWMQAVAASAVTSAFYQPTGDPIEFAIMNYFRNRPHQPKAARDILAAKIKALEGMRSGEIRDYLECLASEGKLIQDGQSFQFAG
jgi:hypothetical protein